MAVSKAQRKAIDKWNAKHEEVRFRVPLGEKEIIQQHAAGQGESTNAFMVRAVKETMARDIAMNKEKECTRQDGIKP